jgi:hypothetical protein
MNPENLLAMALTGALSGTTLYRVVKELFSGGEKQTAGKPGNKIHAMGLTLEEIHAQRQKGRIDKYFGTGVGRKKIDYEKFNLVDSFIKNLYNIEPGATHKVDGEERPIDAIQFIENARAGRSGFGSPSERGARGFKYEIPFPGIANIITDPNLSKKQLGDALKGYAKLFKNPKSREPLPKYRVPQELLSAFGKENAPVIKEFFKQMYPEGDYTSLADIQAAMQLGDKPGGLTLDIGSFLSPEYHGKGRSGWRSQPDFMKTPLSGKYAAYQNRPDAYTKNLALQQLQTSANPLKDIVTSFGEESQYREGIPTSPASINIEAPLNYDPGRILLHEIGHGSPQFVDRFRKDYDHLLHQEPFQKMVEQSYAKAKGAMGILMNPQTGATPSSTAIQKAYMESPEYKQIMNHPVSQFWQMLLDEGFDRRALSGQHFGTQTQYPNQQ